VLVDIASPVQPAIVITAALGADARPPDFWVTSPWMSMLCITANVSAKNVAMGQKRHF
jgi:hypothetical protein